MLLIFGSFAVTFFVLERVLPEREQSLFRTGIRADVLYIPVHYVLRVAMNFLLADAVTAWGRSRLPGGAGLVSASPLWAQVLVVVLVLDLLFYVMHRLKHRWGWWWRLHETHHSSETLDFLASVRFHPVEKILDRALFLLPLAVLDPSQEALVIWSSIDVFFGMLNHSNVELPFGFLKYIFVVPEMHRWHHTRDVRMHGRNFGNNLSIFDWLLGTAALPKDRPEGYGIEEPAYPQENIFRQFLFAFRRRQPVADEVPRLVASGGSRRGG